MEKSDTGKVVYAELTFGDSIVVLGSTDSGLLDEMMLQPDQIDGAETQICYLVVEDIAVFYEQAKAAQADILFYLEQDDTIGEGFSCRDPEGHIWHVATYRSKTAGAATAAPSDIPVPMDIPLPPSRLGLFPGTMSAQKIQTALTSHAPILAAAGFLAIVGGLIAAPAPKNAPEAPLTQLSALHNDVNRYGAQLAEEKEKQQRAERTPELAALEQRVTLSQQQVVEAKSARDKAKQALTDAQQDFQQKIKHVNQTAEELRAQLQAALDARIAIEKKMEETHAGRQAIEAALKRSRKTAQSAGDKGQALKNTKRALLEEQKAKAALKGTITETKRELATLSQTHGKMRKQLASLTTELNSEKKKRLAANKKIKGAQEALAEANDEKKELQQQVSALKTSLSGLKGELETARGQTEMQKEAKKSAKTAPAAKLKKVKKQKIARAQVAAKKSSKKKAKVAAASPSNVKQKERGPSQKQLLAMKRELKRMGCIGDTTESGWDADSADAVNSFIHNNKTRVGYRKGKRVPAGRVLRALRATRSNVCQ